MNYAYDTGVLFDAILVLVTEDGSLLNDDRKSCYRLFERPDLYTLWTVKEEWERRILSKKIAYFCQELYTYRNDPRPLPTILNEVSIRQPTLSGLCNMFVAMVGSSDWMAILNNFRGICQTHALVLIGKSILYEPKNMELFQKHLQKIKEQIPSFAQAKREEDANHVAASATACEELSGNFNFVAEDRGFHTFKKEIAELFKVGIMAPMEVTNG